MKTLRFLSALVLVSLVALAQPNPERFEEIKTRLNLSPEQVEKIRPILQEEAEKIQEIRAKHQGQTARRAKLGMLRELREVQESVQKKVEPLLTKEQREEWKKLREERREELKEQRGALN